MFRHTYALLFFCIADLIRVLSLGVVVFVEGFQPSPSWEQIIDGVQKVGFPIVAYLLLFLGLGAMIMGAVRFFTQKLDQDRTDLTRTLERLSDQIVTSQNNLGQAVMTQQSGLTDVLRELTRANEQVAEGMRMTMLFMARTQSDVMVASDKIDKQHDRIERTARVTDRIAKRVVPEEDA